ncbi:MAG: DUF3617 domain-containing protein [Desulfobacteraceae bacterium]|nr:MAG: DUF3617 domain-containing protein [Desulfobacteraceae bacterium]
MDKKFLLLLIIVLLLTYVSFAAAAPDMKEGLWEITVTSKMEMPGMTMPIPPVKYTQCLTKNDFVPQKNEKGEQCEKVNVTVNGNTVSWTVKCNGKEGPTKGTGKITYKGDAYEGVMNMTFPNEGGGEGKMTSNMSGKWIGKCK